MKKIKTLTQKYPCTSYVFAALYTIANIWKEPKCPSIDEKTKKMLSIYAMEYYSAVKRNEILPFATTWMNLKSITLSEISQTEKDKYCMILLICRI